MNKILENVSLWAKAIWEKIKANINAVLIGIAIIAVIITGVLIFVKSNSGFSFPSIFGMSDKQIGEKVVKYINDNQLSQTPVTLGDVSEESGLVKIKIRIGTTEVDSYATKDGRFLFPTAFDMNPKKTDGSANQNTNNTTASKTADEIIASIKKTGTPALEAFVVSRCPYGLQMQRMIEDAVKNVPSLAQYIKVRYIGEVSGNTITAMHGEAEAKENLRQICIREEQPSKYWAYVGCQMKASGTETSCEKSTGIDSAALSACISAPSRGVAYAQKDFTLANQYGVSGSPTMVINGVTVDEFTADNQPVFGGRVSDEIKTIVCDASTSQLSFCSAKLSTTQAATSFSATYAAGSGSASGDASCGS